MNKTRMVYEPRIVEDIRMPFTLSGEKLYKQKYTTSNAIPISVNWHENIEILYFVDGVAKVTVETEDYTVVKGDILVVNSNLIHRISTESFTKYFYLIPDKDFLEENEINLDGVKFVEKITDSKALQYFENIIEAWESKGNFTVALTRAAVLNLVAFLGQNFSEKINKLSDSKVNAYIKKTLEYIDCDLTRDFNVEEMASRVGVSKYHFMREFKRVTKYSVVEYVNLRRCNRAQILLKDENKTIFDICVLCGFESSSYFSRVFKKYIGISPKEYRTLITKPKDK